MKYIRKFSYALSVLMELLASFFFECSLITSEWARSFLNHSNADNS